MADNAIALFELKQEGETISVVDEKHYRLVPHDQLSAEEVQEYALRSGL